MAIGTGFVTTLRFKVGFGILFVILIEGVSMDQSKLASCDRKMAKSMQKDRVILLD